MRPQRRRSGLNGRRACLAEQGTQLLDSRQIARREGVFLENTVFVSWDRRGGLAGSAQRVAATLSVRWARALKACGPRVR